MSRKDNQKGRQLFCEPIHIFLFDVLLSVDRREFLQWQYKKTRKQCPVFGSEAFGPGQALFRRRIRSAPMAAEATSLQVFHN